MDILKNTNLLNILKINSISSILVISFYFSRYELISECWQHEADDRPTFEQIKSTTRQIYMDARRSVKEARERRDASGGDGAGPSAGADEATGEEVGDYQNSQTYTQERLIVCFH